MCNTPDCKRHTGPVMEPIEGVVQHCQTTLRNQDCPYISLGCLGCTFRTFIPNIPALIKELKAIEGVKVKVSIGLTNAKN